MAGYHVGIIERYENGSLIWSKKAFHFKTLREWYLKECDAMASALAPDQIEPCTLYVLNQLVTFSSVLDLTAVNDILSLTIRPETQGLKIGENFVRIRVDSFK